MFFTLTLVYSSIFQFSIFSIVKKYRGSINIAAQQFVISSHEKRKSYIYAFSTDTFTQSDFTFYALLNGNQVHEFGVVSAML